MTDGCTHTANYYVLPSWPSPIYWDLSIVEIRYVKILLLDVLSVLNHAIRNIMVVIIISLIMVICTTIKHGYDKANFVQGNIKKIAHSYLNHCKLMVANHSKRTYCLLDNIMNCNNVV